MTIVVGHLATREGRAALDAAISEAERRSTRLLLVLSDKGGPASVEAAAEQARGVDEVRQELERHGVPFDIREVTQGRDVAEDLITAAEENDGTLIVIGLRRRSPVGKLILGRQRAAHPARRAVPRAGGQADREWRPGIGR